MQSLLYVHNETVNLLRHAGPFISILVWGKGDGGTRRIAFLNFNERVSRVVVVVVVVLAGVPLTRAATRTEGKDTESTW